MQTWNLTVEQRVKSWLASAGYVASRFIDPQNDLEMNWAPINSGTAGQILNQLTGRTASTLYLGTLGTNTYDALQTRLQGRFSGYQVNFTYTFAKALGYALTPGVQIPQYFHLNRGPQATDISHMFSSSAVAELPFGKGKRWAQSGVASKLAGGWQFSTVVSAHTGTPFTGHRFECVAELSELHSVRRLHQHTPESGRHLWVVREVGLRGARDRTFRDLRNQ